MDKEAQDIIDTLEKNYRLYKSIGKKQSSQDLLKKINYSLKKKGLNELSNINIDNILSFYIMTLCFKLENNDPMNCFMDNDGNPLYDPEK